MNRIVLTADEGKLLTNGISFGSIVYLSDEDDITTWYQVDEQELLETNGFA